MTLPVHQVSAFNTAKASENKIHDDATAQRFGFKGGLVGGVHVYAYMSHMPVLKWGRDWLIRGTGEAKFGKPVYEGDIAEISAVEDAENSMGAAPERKFGETPVGARVLTSSRRRWREGFRRCASASPDLWPYRRRRPRARGGC